MNDEFKVYKWREDKDGNVFDEPVKFKDHLMDGVRYGVYGHTRGIPFEVDYQSAGTRKMIKKSLRGY